MTSLSHCLSRPLQQTLQQNRALQRSTTQAVRPAADVELYTTTALQRSRALYSSIYSSTALTLYILYTLPQQRFKVVLERCERGRFSQSRMLAAARRGPSASPHGPGMHPHTLLSRMPMRSVDAVVVLQLCSAATAPVSRVAAFGRAAPASSAARRRGGTRALRIPSEGRRLERWSRASRQTRRRHP